MRVSVSVCMHVSVSVCMHVLVRCFVIYGGVAVCVRNTYICLFMDVCTSWPYVNAINIMNNSIKEVLVCQHMHNSYQVKLNSFISMETANAGLAL